MRAPAHDEDRLRFYNCQHRHYCGIDLHVKTMYVCILDATGQTLVHRNREIESQRVSRDGCPVSGRSGRRRECMFTWFWLADICAAEGIPFCTGARAGDEGIHGGKAKNDKIDSRKIAGLLRGGLLPQAYVYPAAMRSTRDLLRSSARCR